MLFKQISVLASVLSLAVAAPTQQSFSWGSTKIRGLNIGGWLVLEPWITPSIFQAHPMSMGIVDEYTLGQKLGYDAARSVLTSHWDSWITESDFQTIASQGFNAVRIPIGFWAYNNTGTPYVTGADAYMERAIGWARNAGLKVVVDLHGAPLSQNGFDNSGQRLSKPGWQQGDSVRQTLAVLRTMAQKYAAPRFANTVTSIELLNEPLSSELNLDEIKSFWQSGYGEVRQVSGNVVVMLQDAFQQPSSYNGFMTPQNGNYQNVALDHHEYQVFTNDLVAMAPWQHRQLVCNNARSYTGADKWEVVGEWTAAMTDCAAALNGYGIGARYDGTYPGSSYHGSCGSKNFIDQWDQTMHDDTRMYVEAQMDAFEALSNGWFFWTYKTEASAEWDSQRLIKAGDFPQPLTDRKFAPTCSNYP